MNPSSSSYHQEGHTPDWEFGFISLLCYVPFVQLLVHFFFQCSCSFLANIMTKYVTSFSCLIYLNIEFCGVWLCFKMWTFMFLAQNTDLSMNLCEFKYNPRKSNKKHFLFLWKHILIIHILFIHSILILITKYLSFILFHLYLSKMKH